MTPPIDATTRMYRHGESGRNPPLVVFVVIDFDVTQVVEAVAVASWKAMLVIQFKPSLLASIEKLTLPPDTPVVVNWKPTCFLREMSHLSEVVVWVAALIIVTLSVYIVFRFR